MAYYPNWASRWSECFHDLSGKKVAVLRHVKPDGDCIGSQSALVVALQNSGIDATALQQDKVPENLKFLLSGVSCTYLKARKGELLQFDSFIALDCADWLRVGPLVNRNLKKPFLNIDHHLSNTDFGTNNFVDSGAVATAEILLAIFLDTDLVITPFIAKSLYAGIATDTGQFKYTTTNSRTFEFARILAEKGADPSTIASRLYENQRFGSLQLLERYLANLKISSSGKIAYSFILKKDFADTHTLVEDTEGLVNYGRSLEKVLISLFIYEDRKCFKVSLRTSEPNVALHCIAEQYGGGGHPCAAGFAFKGSLKEILSELVDEMEDRLQQLNG